MTAPIAPAIRLLAALRSGAVLVARRRGVAHVYTGPLTPSGASVPRARRAVCRVRTRRLGVLSEAAVVELRRRRVCRRCMAMLPPSLGRDVPRLVTRDEWMAAYDHLTVADLTLAGSWSLTVEQTHQVGFLAQLLHGPASRAPVGSLSAQQAEVVAMHAAIRDRRAALVAASRTPEEVAQVERRRENEALDLARIDKARREEAAFTRAIDRQARGRYLAPWERQHVS